MVLDEFPRQLARTRRFTLGVPRAVTISADGGRVLYLRTNGGEDPVSRLWLLDLAHDAGEQLLADPTASWNVGSGEVPEAERIRRERVRELASGIVAYSADDSCRTVAFALDGQLWVLASSEANQAHQANQANQANQDGVVFGYDSRHNERPAIWHTADGGAHWRVVYPVLT